MNEGIIADLKAKIFKAKKKKRPRLSDKLTAEQKREYLAHQLRKYGVMEAEAMYREDLMIQEGAGKVIRTVTGRRRKTNQRVRAAIAASKEARYHRRKAGHIADFMRRPDGSVISPQNKVSDAIDNIRSKADRDIRKLPHPAEARTRAGMYRNLNRIIDADTRKARAVEKLQKRAAKGERAAKAMRESLIEMIMEAMSNAEANVYRSRTVRAKKKNVDPTERGFMKKQMMVKLRQGTSRRQIKRDYKLMRAKGQV